MLRCAPCPSKSRAGLSAWADEEAVVAASPNGLKILAAEEEAAAVHSVIALVHRVPLRQVTVLDLSRWLSSRWSGEGSEQQWQGAGVGEYAADRLLPVAIGRRPMDRDFPFDLRRVYLDPPYVSPHPCCCCLVPNCVGCPPKLRERRASTALSSRGMLVLAGTPARAHRTSCQLLPTAGTGLHRRSPEGSSQINIVCPREHAAPERPPG